MSRLFCQGLMKAGIRHIISIPGAQLLSLWDEAARTNELSLIVPRNEWNGVWLASGYSLHEQRPALISNTLGPGAANELPALMGAGLYASRLLLLHLRQPPEKLAHIERVFQGLNTTPTHAPWLEESFRAKKAAEIPSALQQALVHLNSAKPRKACRVRIEVEFPMLFAKIPRSEFASAVAAPLPALKTNEKINYLWIGSKEWRTKLKRTFIFASKVSASKGSLNKTQSRGLTPHPEITDLSHVHSLGLGFLLAGGRAAFVQSSLELLSYDLDTLLLAEELGIALTICISDRKQSPIEERKDKLSELQKITHFTLVNEGLKKHLKKRANPSGLYLEL